MMQSRMQDQKNTEQVVVTEPESSSTDVGSDSPPIPQKPTPPNTPVNSQDVTLRIEDTQELSSELQGLNVYHDEPERRHDTRFQSSVMSQQQQQLEAKVEANRQDNMTPFSKSKLRRTTKAAAKAKQQAEDASSASDPSKLQMTYPATWLNKLEEAAMKFRPVASHPLDKMIFSRYKAYPSYERNTAFEPWYLGFDNIVCKLHPGGSPSEIEMCEYLTEKMPQDIQNAIYTNPRVEKKSLTNLRQYIMDVYALKSSPKKDMRELTTIEMKRGTFAETMNDIEAKVGNTRPPMLVEEHDSDEMREYKRNKYREDAEHMISAIVVTALQKGEPTLYDMLVMNNTIDPDAAVQDYQKLRRALLKSDNSFMEKTSEDEIIKFQIVKNVEEQPKESHKVRTDNKKAANRRNIATETVTPKAGQKNEALEMWCKVLTSEDSPAPTSQAVLTPMKQKPQATYSQQSTVFPQSTTRVPVVDKQQRIPQPAVGAQQRKKYMKQPWCRKCFLEGHKLEKCTEWLPIEREPVKAKQHQRLDREGAVCFLCCHTGHYATNCHLYTYVHRSQITQQMKVHPQAPR